MAVSSETPEATQVLDVQGGAATRSYEEKIVTHVLSEAMHTSFKC